ncbi:MAG: hypothetical protein WC523_05025 [Patescibacteria group bacterium]
MKNEKGKGNRNIQEILQYHLKTKRFIGGLCKIEKDGSVRKLNGQIFAIKTTKNGLCSAVIDNFLGNKRPGDKKRWQMVLTKNLLQINEHGWKHEKVE